MGRRVKERGCEELEPMTMVPPHSPGSHAALGCTGQAEATRAVAPPSRLGRAAGQAVHKTLVARALRDLPLGCSARQRRLLDAAQRLNDDRDVGIREDLVGTGRGVVGVR